MGIGGAPSRDKNNATSARGFSATLDHEDRGHRAEAIGSADVSIAVADLSAELRSLCAAVTSTRPPERHFELSLSITDGCYVPAHWLGRVALIANEALSNAISYAHPSGVAGRISVVCGQDGKGAIAIDVADDGVGLPEGFDPTADGGRGLQLMHQLTSQLGATLKFKSSCLGLTVELRLPPSAKRVMHQITESGSRRDGALQAGDLWHQVFQALPAAIYTTDPAGRITFYNEAAAELWGCRPELGLSEFCGSWKLYWPDGTPLPHDECPMALSLREKRPIRGMEAVAERPDGSRILFIPYPTPLLDASGELVGAVNMLVDVSAQRQVAQQLASIVESSNDAIISKDLNTIIKTWNRGAQQLFGYAAEEVIGRSVTILIPPERHDEEPRILERIARGERVEHYETVRQRKDGSLVDVSLTVSPVKSAVGRIIGASKIARDITDKKRHEAQRELLLNEIAHRSKNTLATVQALATQTFISAPRAELDTFAGRLRALGNAYDLLTNANWDRAPVRSIVDRTLEPFQTTRFVIEGPDLWLNSAKSLQLTMALHELATNGVKYGALSNPSGKVCLTWDKQDGNRLRFTWQETGGPPVSPPKREGFGSMLIRRTFDNVQFEFAPTGVICILDVAL